MKNNYLKTKLNRPTMQDDYGDTVTEARVLPAGGAGNIICGIKGYKQEMQFRRECNKNLNDRAKFDLPSWESLRVYFADGEYKD